MSPTLKTTMSSPVAADEKGGSGVAGVAANTDTLSPAPSSKPGENADAGVASKNFENPTAAAKEVGVEAAETIGTEQTTDISVPKDPYHLLGSNTPPPPGKKRRKCNTPCFQKGRAMRLLLGHPGRAKGFTHMCTYPLSADDMLCQEEYDESPPYYGSNTRQEQEVRMLAVSRREHVSRMILRKIFIH